MLQVARLAPSLLHDAGDRVVEFLRRQFNDDGGAKDRAGECDLYYTVFATEGLIAFREQPDTQAIHRYLQSFGTGQDLDFVHLTCLARCGAALGGDALPEKTARAILDRIEACRARDGGYNASPDAETGTVYHSFLAFGVYQDLGETMPQPNRLLDSINALRTEDGGYANDQTINIGTTPTTAAAVALLRQLGEPVPRSAGDWLKRQCHAQGGFLAMPLAPMPDLLSTATALHALAGMHVPIDDIKDRCLDFIDSLWTGQAFCATWADDAVDSEYIYYALLALGHLSL